MDNFNRFEKLVNFKSIQEILEKSKKFNFSTIGHCKSILYNDILYLFGSEEGKTMEFIWLSSAECAALENQFKIFYFNDNLREYLN